MPLPWKGGTQGFRVQFTSGHVKLFFFTFDDEENLSLFFGVLPAHVVLVSSRKREGPLIPYRDSGPLLTPRVRVLYSIRGNFSSRRY